MNIIFTQKWKEARRISQEQEEQKCSDLKKSNQKILNERMQEVEKAFSKIGYVFTGYRTSNKDMSLGVTYASNPDKSIIRFSVNLQGGITTTKTEV